MLDVVVKHDIKVKSNIFYGLQEIPKVVELLRQGRYQGKGVIVVDKKLLKSEER
jgi:propanol-preferring alcohol dehydrogenase